MNNRKDRENKLTVLKAKKKITVNKESEKNGKLDIENEIKRMMKDRKMNLANNNV